MTLRQQLCGAAAGVIMVGTGHAQERQEQPVRSVFTAGSRVRIQSPTVGGQLQGVVASVDEKVLTLMAEGSIPVVVPRVSITAAEMKVGQKRHTWLGLGAGALVGLVLGLAVPVDPTCGTTPSSPTWCVKSSSERADAIVYSAAGVGTIGAGIGWLVKSEQWTPIQVGTRPVASGGAPFGLRITVRF